MKIKTLENIINISFWMTGVLLTAIIIHTARSRGMFQGMLAFTCTFLALKFIEKQSNHLRDTIRDLHDYFQQ